jgi:hypothetical protein
LLSTGFGNGACHVSLQKAMTSLLGDMGTRLGLNLFSYASNNPGDTLAFELVFANLTKKTLPTATSAMEEIMRQEKLP